MCICYVKHKHLTLRTRKKQGETRLPRGVRVGVDIMLMTNVFYFFFLEDVYKYGGRSEGGLWEMNEVDIEN